MSSKLSTDFIEHLMEEALEEARKAYQLGEVPIGAVISKGSDVIARAHNLVEKDSSVTKHAEILVIEQAGRKLNDWRLKDCTLCVTIEPCSMCIGSIKLARVSNLIFGAHDPSMGACGTIYDLSIDPRFGTVPRIVSGVMEQECRELITNFFKEKRQDQRRV